MSFFRSPKSGSYKWKDLGCTEDAEVFPSQISEVYCIPHQIDSVEMGITMQKDDSAGQHSRAFCLYGTSQHPQPCGGNHPSGWSLSATGIHLYLNLFLNLPSGGPPSSSVVPCGPLVTHRKCRCWGFFCRLTQWIVLILILWSKVTKISR